MVGERAAREGTRVGVRGVPGESRGAPGWGCGEGSVDTLAVRLIKLAIKS